MGYEDEALEALLDEQDEDDDELTGLSPWARASQQSWTYAYWTRDLKPVRPSNKKMRHVREDRLSRLMGLSDTPCPICILDAEDAGPPPSGVRSRLTPEAAPESERRPRKKA